MSLRETRILSGRQADRTAVDRMAAIVTSRASWLHQPPVPEATFAPDPVVEYRNQLRAQIAQKEKENAKRKAQRKNRLAARQKPTKPKLAKCLWVRRHLKQLHRAKGLPPPTEAQILAMKQQQSQYGKPIQGSHLNTSANPTASQPRKADG